MAVWNKWAMFFRSLVEDIKASWSYVGENCALHDFVMHFFRGVSHPLRNIRSLCIRVKDNNLSLCLLVGFGAQVNVKLLMKTHFWVCEQISNLHANSTIAEVLHFVLKKTFYSCQYTLFAHSDLCVLGLFSHTTCTLNIHLFNWCEFYWISEYFALSDRLYFEMFAS